MLARTRNTAAKSAASSAPGQFAGRLAHWNNVGASIASIQREFDSARAAVRAVTAPKVEVQS